jgi:hypothetical protein
MKSPGIVLLIGSLLAPPLGSSNDAWQTGRIVDVQKNVTTKTLYWLVNTPVTQDETTYTVSVHLKDKVFTGAYEAGRVQGAPPEEWVKDRPVKVQIDDDLMYLRAPAGNQFKLNIVKRKSAAMMRPVTAAELAEAYASPAANPDDSVTGFIPPATGSATAPTPRQQPASAAQPAAAPAAASKPAAEPAGTIAVRSTPYLADVYVDGQNMGYTPAKLSLPPGKHAVRFEKQGYKTWSKEITLTAGSELLLDATLEKK